jgi:hypothetical protein
LPRRAFGYISLQRTYRKQKRRRSLLLPHTSSLTTKLHPMFALTSHGGSSANEFRRCSEFSNLVELSLIVSNHREGGKPENVHILPFNDLGALATAFSWLSSSSEARVVTGRIFVSLASGTYLVLFVIPHLLSGLSLYASLMHWRSPFNLTSSPSSRFCDNTLDKTPLATE